jgi:AcrR family transcriptional regulator
MVVAETRANGNGRRERLLDVARDIFAERGYRATTMDDVANAAGFTKPILYQHFVSKESLYNEIVEATAAKLLAALEDATTRAEGPRVMVESAFRVFFFTVVNETAAFRLLFLQPPVGDSTTELRKIETRLAGFIEERLPLTTKPEDRREIASSLVGMAEGAATSWLIQLERAGWPPVDEAEAGRLASLISTLAWGGLRAVPMG